MKVENMISNNGNSVPNQFIIRDYGYTYFQSYDSVIVKLDIKNQKTYLDERYWDYSKTTGKYRNQFLGETKKETESKIKSGEYILTDLNG
jgi:hypothetical protein